FFFFSSRRRHTRFSRDWSSDVCSSDLAREPDAMVLDREDFARDLELCSTHLYADGKAELWYDDEGMYFASHSVYALIEEDGTFRSEERRVGKEWRSRSWRDL